tara:strand:+ start:357 stop:698 length:342 start_codon:yes stop_codon:yes gene_type:complete
MGSLLDKEEEDVFECYECGGFFDAQHIEAKYEFDLCLFCEAEAYDCDFAYQEMSDESDDPDYVPETEPESEDYNTDEEEPVIIEEMEIVCDGDTCEIKSKWAEIASLDGRLSP